MKPFLHPFTIVCAFAFSICGAQSAGVAVLKKQTFHDDASASAVVFTEIIDSYGPYLRIVSGSRNIEILRSNLVERIELPDGIPASIMEEEDLTPLRVTLAEVMKFTARYPRSAPLLKKETAALTAHISRFDAGEVRFEGAWISKKELGGIMETREREHEALERVEVEKRVFEAAQRDKGFVLHNGKWMTKLQMEQLPPGSATELSDCIEPLWNGDLQGAKYAVKSLTDLASRQTGAPKVRTERLMAVVRNLFSAEVRLSQRIIASAGESKEAAKHDKNAKKWLIPNAFGTVSKEGSRDSSEKAKQIRQHSKEQLALCRRELIDQLKETDGVTEDFHKLREYIVVLTLAKAVRAVSSRHFTTAEFCSSFPEESLVSIRQRVIQDRDSAPAR